MPLSFDTDFLAWALFDAGGGTVSVTESKNVSSVSRSSTGIYKVNLSITLDAAAEQVLAISNGAQTHVNASATTTATAEIHTRNTAGTLFDGDMVFVAIQGVKA